MAKLSYIARKTTGLKAAQTCHKDLKKKVITETTGSTRSSTSTKDSHLELLLSGKQIGDEGLKLVCEGLLEAIEKGNIKLDELHLGQNAITVNGLMYLGPVVRAASGQLRDLDLSGNGIRVVGEKDGEVFEGFLRVVGEVETLIRLDLSGNPLGEGLGMELMYRAYAKEDSLVLDRSGISKSESEAEIDSASRKSKKSRGKGRDSGVGIESDNNLISIDCRGLRSIPYLVLSDIQLDDAATLHLSYILEKHYSPQILIGRFPNFKAGSHLAGVIATLEKGEEANSGVIYVPNQQCSPAALRLLIEADRVRRLGREFLSWTSLDEDQGDAGGSERGEWGFGKGQSELARLRSKIQGDVINKVGARRVELWAVCIDMLQIARVLLPTRIETAPPTVVCSVEDLSRSPGTADTSQSLKTTSTNSTSSSTATLSENRRIPSDTKDTYNEHFPVLSRTTSNTSSLKLGSTPPNSNSLPGIISLAKPITLRLVNKVSSSKPKLALKKSSAKPQPASTTNISTLKPSLAVPTLPKPKPDIHAYIAKNFPSTHHPILLHGNLPPSIWRRILSYATDPKEITTVDQQVSILEFGTCRDTLRSGHELRGKRVGTQIWEFLDRVGGLEYEMQ